MGLQLHYGKESHLNGEAEVENALRHQLARDRVDLIAGCEKYFNFGEAARYYGLRRQAIRRREIMFRTYEPTNDAVIKVIGVGGGGGNVVEHYGARAHRRC